MSKARWGSLSSVTHNNEMLASERASWQLAAPFGGDLPEVGLESHSHGVMGRLTATDSGETQ